MAQEWARYKGASRAPPASIAFRVAWSLLKRLSMMNLIPLSLFRIGIYFIYHQGTAFIERQILMAVRQF
jgi:hypothetical protein